MRGNADRNASIVIGKRLLARYQQNLSQEKPHTPLEIESPVKTGVFVVPKTPKVIDRPSTDLARHGTANALGTAQDTIGMMVLSVSGIVRQLLLFNES